MLIRVLNHYNDFCLHKSDINRNDNWWPFFGSWQLVVFHVDGKDNSYKVQQWDSSVSKVEFPNPLMHLVSPVLKDVNRHCQTLILLKHKNHLDFQQQPRPTHTVKQQLSRTLKEEPLMEGIKTPFGVTKCHPTRSYKAPKSIFGDGKWSCQRKNILYLIMIHQ